MTVISCTDSIYKHPSDAQTFAMIFSEPLFGRTVLSASVSATSGLTVDSAMVNASTFVADDTGETIPIGEAVTYNCSSGTAGTDYQVTVTATLSDGSTLVGVQTVKVRST